jgi:hypothetical protein
MYIRFVVGADYENHRWLTGVITEAKSLRECGELLDFEVERLREINDWLKDNLPVPPFSTDYRLLKGSCWFKSQAGDAIEKIWEIVALLKQHDIPVRMLRSTMPGKILYEDDFQIVAEEYKTL